MTLTKQQADRLEELEAMQRAGTLGVSLEVYLPDLSDEAVWSLAKRSEAIEDRAPELAAWLKRVAVDEIYARASDDVVEAKTPCLPVDWPDTEVAKAMQVAVAMLASNLNRELDQFYRQLALAIAAIGAKRLTKEQEENA